MCVFRSRMAPDGLPPAIRQVHTLRHRKISQVGQKYGLRTFSVRSEEWRSDLSVGSGKFASGFE